MNLHTQIKFKVLKIIILVLLFSFLKGSLTDQLPVPVSSSLSTLNTNTKRYPFPIPGKSKKGSILPHFSRDPELDTTLRELGCATARVGVWLLVQLLLLFQLQGITSRESFLFYLFFICWGKTRKE